MDHARRVVGLIPPHREDDERHPDASARITVQRTFIGTALKAASSGVGLGPLAGLEKFASIYSRSIKGGGARVVRVGPKDARVNFVGLPYANVRYFRIAYRGFIQAGCEFFAQRVHVAESRHVAHTIDGRVPDRVGLRRRRRVAAQRIPGTIL